MKIQLNAGHRLEANNKAEFDLALESLNNCFSEPKISKGANGLITATWRNSYLIPVTGASKNKNFAAELTCLPATGLTFVLRLLDEHGKVVYQLDAQGKTTSALFADIKKQTNAQYKSVVDRFSKAFAEFGVAQGAARLNKRIRMAIDPGSAKNWIPFN